ncbi:cupin domain-containing protein [Candidatus Pacearchaeota archaeon]|nr:cupin domain-containing protein [Candidatus Pacearchaeota archaeon]
MASTHIKSGSLEWEVLKQGICRKILFREDSRNLEIDLIRLEPSAQSPIHTHKGDEWVYVLEGSMSDQTGTYNQGDFLINQKGTEHQVTAGRDGCLILALYSEKPY